MRRHIQQKDWPKSRKITKERRFEAHKDRVKARGEFEKQKRCLRKLREVDPTSQIAHRIRAKLREIREFSLENFGTPDIGKVMVRTKWRKRLKRRPVTEAPFERRDEAERRVSESQKKVAAALGLTLDEMEKEEFKYRAMSASQIAPHVQMGLEKYLLDTCHKKEGDGCVIFDDETWFAVSNPIADTEEKALEVIENLYAD